MYVPRVSMVSSSHRRMLLADTLASHQQTVTDYYKLNAQKEQLEKSLMQSSHTVKEYISQANKSKLELYSALEARDKVR